MSSKFLAINLHSLLTVIFFLVGLQKDQENRRRAADLMMSFNPLLGLTIHENPGEGVTIKDVPEGLPAFASGFREGDQIVQFNQVRKSSIKKSFCFMLLCGLELQFSRWKLM